MILYELEAVLRERSAMRPGQGSYTADLLADPERLQRKVVEEAFELCLELGRPQRRAERVAEEAADLIYHVIVGLVSAGVALDDVMAALDRRRR